MAEQTHATSPGFRPYSTPVIHYQEPAIRKPPTVETGVIGWAHINLFGSLADTVLTLVSLAVIVFVLRGLFRWSIVEAEWEVITRNMRLFVAGRYPAGEVYRIGIVALLFVFLAGVNWRTVGSAPRWLAAAAAMVGLLLFGVPLFTGQIALPPVFQYLSAEAQGQPDGLVFPVEAGDEITVRLFPALPREGIPTGYSDSDTAAMAGTAERDAAQYDALLARAAAGEAVDVPPPPAQPNLTASARVLNAATLAELEALSVAAGTANPAASFTVEAPTSGWYIVQPGRGGEQGAYWLAVNGVEVIPSSEAAKRQFVERYGEPPDELDGARVRIADRGFLGFRGARTFALYLRLQLQPFFETIRNTVALLIGAAAVGYLAGQWLRRQPWRRRALHFGWALSFVLVIIILRGVSERELEGWTFVLLSVTLAVPALVVIFGTRFVERSDRSWHLRAGLTLVLAMAGGAAVAGWGTSLAIVAIAGLALILYALETESQRTYTTWTIAGLAATLLYYGLVQALVQPQPNAALLPVIPTERWGGLVLTLALAVVSITASFPVGILLALGRRSELPAIRVFSVGAIEFVRGVPLITILFMANVMVPLLSPQLATVDNVIRAMAGMTLFSAAYVAEIVRGGLQSVPYGQTEAARAVGMAGWQITVYITLPQALRAVVPALVGQFISLFKDTSLVFIIGLIELLGVARTVINQAEFIGTQREALVFIGIIYFIGSYAMSYASRRIEASGAGAATQRL